MSNNHQDAPQDPSRNGIFAGDNPFEIARRWLDEAQRTEPNDPNAIALATVDNEGRPDVRMVLLKDIEQDSFVFYTNYNSAKGQQITDTGVAAFVLHWKSLRRQIRVRGTVGKVEQAKADAYYASRPLQSRIGAWASPQSQPIASRTELMAQVAKQSARHGLTPARPPFWGGFRIKPFQIEFWADGAFRLHDRFRWTALNKGADHTPQWQVERLAP